MSSIQHYTTAPEDRIPFWNKVAYGFGNFANNMLGAAIGCMSIILIIGLKLNPGIVGIVMAVPRIVDALTDPVMGHISDTTSSRWGRRRPYIFFGAITVGISFALMWQFPSGFTDVFYYSLILIGSIIFYVAYTVFATPFVALGYEMTPDYHERTRLMGVSNWMGQIAWLVLPWFYWFMYNKECYTTCSNILNVECGPVAGARGLAILVGIVVILGGVLPAIFCRERFCNLPDAEKTKTTVAQKMVEFFKGFLITIKSKPFLKLCAGTFLVFNGFMLVSAFTSYIIIYYLFSGDHELAGKYVGLYGMVSSIATMCVIPIVTYLSTKFGKRRAFIITTFISLIGYLLKWFCFIPGKPYLIFLVTPLVAFGLGGLFTLMGAMMADVCDLDELQTGHRREGMFGSIYWWVVKLGVSLALLLSGYLLVWTGFDIELGSDQLPSAITRMRIFDIAAPVAAGLIAILIMMTYKITEERAHCIRKELEERRGATAEPTAS